MDDEARKTLELFVEKADRLVKYIRENHARNSIVVNPGGLIGVFRNAEGEEWQIASTLDGFLVVFASQDEGHLLLGNPTRETHLTVRRCSKTRPPALTLLLRQGHITHHLCSQVVRFSSSRREG